MLWDLLPGKAHKELPVASHGLQWLSWIVMGETGPGLADRKDRSKGMTEVGVGEAAWETWLHGGAWVRESQQAGTRV